MAKSLDIIDPKKDLKSPDQDEREEVFEQRPQRSSGGIFYLVLGIIALVVAVAVALYILYRDSNPSATTENSPVSSVIASQSSVVSPTSSVAITTPSPATDTITFKYTNQQIRIANGNNISGEAAKVKKILEEAGFKIASVGNASRTYSESIVYYKSGQQDLAEALKDAIKGSYAASIKEDNSVVGSYDAVVVLGSK